MSEGLPSRYDHKSSEPKIYNLWERSGYFNPDRLSPVSAEPSRNERRTTQKIQRKSASNPRNSAFCIIMPPPNANAPLHLGHAVFVTLQDILTRFWRMRGRRTLWLPGADHAGFETQVVFDKKLEKEGRNRFQIPREELWQEMWNFTQENKKVMESQLRKLGASADWSREKFTLDANIVSEVQKTFIKLYEDGLIYRDIRIINWCPKHKTALSDLEIKYVEREDPLYYIKYGPLTLATVRPETKFGDTALAVNPKDKHYQKYIGKTIEAEGVLGPLKFKVIADDAVDPKFGTGVIKVTPAHDAADFEIWQRHKNEIPGPKIIIDENGRLTGETGEFIGLKVAEAREKVAEAMEKIEILEKVDHHYKHQVATCYKCGTTLEPLPKPQWFVKMQPLAKKAIEVVQKGKIKFYPERIKKVYFHWLKNIRDWNISRQIVWGIRIPAYFCMSCGEIKINPRIKSRWFLVRHGETDWNRERRTQGYLGASLNETGRMQVQKTAQALQGIGIDLIISSDLERSKETAEIIKKTTGAEIIFDERFRERGFGVVEGMSIEERNQKYGDLFSVYDKTYPGGETFEEVEKRAVEALRHHKRNHGHKNIAIVTHGGTIHMLRKYLKNLDLPRAFDYHIGNAEILELDLGEPCKKCGCDFYEQDPDVFDTWFSSGQWPYLALGYPKGKDYKTFYPTDVMETGYDILFFWVARMIMMGLYRTGKIPFKTVYLHGLVRDKDRQKMSKSKGNVIDPLGVAEIYGTDAVRMALVVGNTAGNDIVISEDKIRGYRNFATKIWNASRFVLMNKPANSKKQIAKSKEDLKNLKELAKIKAKITRHLEKFEFHLAAEKTYHYFWHTFADKVIESYKPRLGYTKLSAVVSDEALGAPAGSISDEVEATGARSRDRRPQESANRDSEEAVVDRNAAYQTLETILTECLKMLHPFMPFITEEIYQKFKPDELLMIEKW